MAQSTMERQSREREFHNIFYASRKHRHGVRSILYSITNSIYKAYITSVLTGCRNTRVLELGCGDGERAAQIAERGANVSGIDISETAVALAARRLASLGFEAEFKVMDAESLEYADGEFDLVCGEGILHHLETRAAVREICRVLKPDGRALFTEPLASNPMVRVFRRITPGMRTADEHPLTRTDLEFIGSNFEQREFRFYYVTTPLALVFYPLNLHLPVARSLDRMEAAMFRWFPPSRLMAWQVLLTLQAPRRAAHPDSVSGSRN